MSSTDNIQLVTAFVVAAFLLLFYVRECAHRSGVRLSCLSEAKKKAVLRVITQARHVTYAAYVACPSRSRALLSGVAVGEAGSAQCTSLF